jgi:hypothetical protein
MMNRAIPTAAALVHLALGAAPASGPAAPPPEAGAQFVVEITSVGRQVPPAELVTQLEQLEAKLAHANAQERAGYQRSLDRVIEDIERQSGYVALGWAAEVDERGERVGTSTSMAGFFVAASPAAMLLASAKPGDFVALGRQGMRDLFTAEGRRFREARRIDKAGRPGWWSSPGSRSAPPPPTEGAERGVQVTVSFVRDEARARGSHLYRWNLRIESADAPPGARTMWVTLHVVPRIDDRAYGPVTVELSMDRSARTGTFAMHRSFEIIAAPRVAIDKDALAVEVVAVAYR